MTDSAYLSVEFERLGRLVSQRPRDPLSSCGNEDEIENDEDNQHGCRRSEMAADK
jgi:hypothetical protein